MLSHTTNVINASIYIYREILVYINVITLYIGDHVHVFQLAQDKAQNFLSASLHSPLHHPVLPTHWGPAVAQELPRCSGTGRRLSNAWLQRCAFQHLRELTVTKKQESKKLKKDCTSYGGVYSGKKCLVCALDQKSNFNNFQQWIDFFLMDGFVVCFFLPFFKKKKKRKKKEKHLRFYQVFLQQLQSDFWKLLFNSDHR